MASEHQQVMTIEEYFRLEETDTENRYEYIDGQVILLAGRTFNHNTICGNIYSLLRELLRRKPCRVYNSDIKVRISQKRYFYPDITISCDQRDRGTGALLHSPRVVFEVLYPGTELADRTWKLQNYLALPTLEEYILVNTKSFKLEVYHRENGRWIYDIYEAPETVALSSIDLQFPLMDAYIDIELEETPEE